MKKTLRNFVLAAHAVEFDEDDPVVSGDMPFTALLLFCDMLVLVGVIAVAQLIARAASSYFY